MRSLLGVVTAYVILIFIQIIAVLKGVAPTSSPCIYLVSGHDPVSENNLNGLPGCCAMGNCTFSSLADALTQVTDNVIVNITTDFVLTSNVTVGDVSNIVITAQTNSTVYCTNNSSVRFVSCSTVTIEGITWEGCAGIQFYNSSDTTAQNCFFNNSTGQAVRLSRVSGDVHIYSCQFTNNNQYDGPGAAVHYLSGTEIYPHPLLVITNCMFTSNGPAESVVYISSPNNLNGNLSLYDVMFADNQGTPINISNFHVHVIALILLLILIIQM